MTKMIIFGTVLLLSLTACSDKKTDNGPTPTPETTAQIVTNTSQCYGRTPVGTNIYSNKWAMKIRVSNGVLLTSVLGFKYGRADATLWAQYQDQVGKVRVYTSFEERGSSLRYQESDVASDNIQVDGRPYNFSISFTKQTARYKFAGPCLVLERGSEEVVTLVPYYR